MSILNELSRTNARVRRDRIASLPDSAIDLMLGHPRVLNGILADLERMPTPAEREHAEWDREHAYQQHDEAFGA